MSVFVTRTSQKLNFAQLQLEQLTQAEASDGWSRQALIASCQESVLFHLASAYVAFLREIAEHYRLDTGQVNGFADLERLFEKAGISSPEGNELASLEHQAGSWLRLMRQGYDACWQPLDKPQAVGAEPSRSEIKVVQLNAVAPANGVTPLLCRQWCAQLARLIERLRAGMQEW